MKKITLLAILCTLTAITYSQIKATTENGKRVELSTDGTWGYVDTEPYDEGLSGLTIFSEKGECIPTNELEVIEVYKPNMALARTDEWHDMIMVLLINYDGKSSSYYDDQKIKIPSGKCARHIGTYQYTSSVNRQYHKTVPAVVIE